MAPGLPDRACCAVTAGATALYSQHGGPVRHFPAFHVQVVDTTGCGDVFHGAYCASIAHGEGVDRAIEIATAMAGLKATHRAGAPASPTAPPSNGSWRWEPEAGMRGLAEAEYRLLEAGSWIPSAMNTCQFAIRNPQSAIPLGLFDSGVGGLSVMRELMRQAPAQPVVYLADQAHTPYGQRSLAEIRALSEAVTCFLLREGAQVIVIACNTASAAALRSLRDTFPEVPFVGMEPAIKPAAEHTRTGHVGVIATEATFQGELFASLMDRFTAGITVHTQACPELVPLVEAGELDSERTRAALQRYLRPLLEEGIDELVLGCTHYPFLRRPIEQVVGAGVEIVDPAPAVARQAIRVLVGRNGLADGAQAAAHRFYTSADPGRFRCALRELIGLDVEVREAAWSKAGGLRSLRARPR
jgi:glutamate racemase